MSTNGLWGIRKDGIDKLTYNHCDSYPDWLGANVVDFVKNADDAKLAEIFDGLVMVDSDALANNEQFEECKQYLDVTVGRRNERNWYCLLRNSQGNPDCYLKGLKYMTDDGYFIHDSLACEYGYIINLDTGMLELWEGLQNTPDTGNRYGAEVDGWGYYPCRLALELKLEAVRNADVDKVVEEMKSAFVE